MLPKLVALVATISLAAAQVPRTRYVPSSDEIRSILQERIDRERRGTGIVVGVVDSTGQRIVSYPSALNGDTIFEIGSLTKVFTALLLSEMVQRREVALTDPVAKYLPVGVKVPQSITLEDLATHTSGLPRNPSNLTEHHYTPQMLYDFFSGYQPAREVQWRYSNLGYGLLGLALAPNYEKAVRSRISGLLEMNSTRIELGAELKSRLAAGHNEHLAPVPASDFGALAAAGALHSSASDMLKFLAAFLGRTNTPLAPAIAAMLDVRKPTTQPGLTNALGWQISLPDGLEIVWKDGTTAGYSSFLGYSPQKRIGVVVLSNTSTARGVNDIGMHVLDSTSPLFRLPHHQASQ